MPVVTASALPHASLLLGPAIALSGCSFLRGGWPSLPGHCSLSAALTAVRGARGLQTRSSSSLPGIKTGYSCGLRFSLALP